MPLGSGHFGSAWRRAIVGILTSVAGGLTVQAADAELLWQSPESIRAAAREAVLQSGSEGSSLEIEAVAVDQRLRLPQCPEALQTRIERAVQRGRGTVTVSCGAAPGWRLFVPVRVTEQVAVLVTQRNLKAGEVLAVADIEVRRQSSSSLPFDYFSGPEQVVGLVVRRAQPAGAVLTPGAVERPEAIERGALVTLVAGSGSVAVRSEGVALEPARLQERIRVRSVSGRVIEGTVEAPGQVRVGF